MSAVLSRDRLQRFAQLSAELKKREERSACEADLSTFVRHAWPSIDPTEYQSNWAVDALCEHLAAVTKGHIRRLLINFPPRCAKSSVASICWPAWTWTQSQREHLAGPQVRFLCGSYNHDLSLQLSNKTRRLILSPWYQSLWGETVALRSDQNTKGQFDTVKGGSRIATSVGGTLIGIGGDVCLVDDPHNTEEVESDADRATAERWWKELSTTRLNDPKRSALVVVMQRLHENDISGLISGSEEYRDWTHLMLPMRHDPDRHCVTVLKWDDEGQPERTWEDPRTKPGQLLWPERFGHKEIRAMEVGLGDYLSSGRLQQSPTPPKGGIIDRDWWQLYEPVGGKFPKAQRVVVSVDTAYTEKEENDPTGCTVWASWVDKNCGCDLCKSGRLPGHVKLILMGAWRKRLKLRGVEMPAGANETYEQWVQRTRPNWGVVEWLAHTCRRYRADDLLIESKASGISVAQEIQRLHAHEGWNIVLNTPDGDKVSRLISVSALFSAGLVYAPDREWADMVIDEVRLFPKGRYKDLTDSLSQALTYFRRERLLQMQDERREDDRYAARYQPALPPLYPA